MKLLIVLFTLFIWNFTILAKDLKFQIIPKPQHIEMLKGKGIMYHEIRFILNESDTQYPTLSPILNALPRKEKKGKGIFLHIKNNNVPESTEGYVLKIENDGIHISSKSSTGLFYGCQTVEQLMEDSRDFQIPIPRMEITDYPAISYRAIHLDTKHHLDRMEYYYQMMDKLAKYKINAVIWELEDKFRYTSHPELAASNAISKQEMQALCQYAKERHIEISPLVQGLGHASYILKHHWNLRENPKSDWELCPSNPKTYELLFDLYGEAIEAMPDGKYLHIGGDEITAIGIDERCRATGKSAFELQMDWLNKVCQFAHENGRIPIFWDDMPLKYANLWTTVLGDKTEEELDKIWNTEKLDRAIDMFPKNCIYMRWNYGDPTKPAHKRLLNWYKEKGLPVMAATAASSGDSPYMPRENTKSGYIRSFCQLTKENELNGVLATAWDDGSPHLETVWRGYIALGEFSWNPNGRSIPDFVEAHVQREFGVEAGKGKMDCLQELEKSFFFVDGALVKSGRRNPAWGVTNFTLIDLPDKKNRGAWTEKYNNKIKQAQNEDIRFEKIKKELTEAKEEALRNRYTLDIYEQNNNLQNFPVKLLLALYHYDQAKTDQELKQATQQIRNICNYFTQLKQTLKEVYSKTRFMEQPEGYVEDMNHHNHLSIQSLNSDWIFLYELPMVTKTLNWINAQ